MILIPSMPPKVSPYRKRVVPQSPQKLLVMDFPLSAVLEMVFGVPAITLKFSLGTTTLLE